MNFWFLILTVSHLTQTVSAWSQGGVATAARVLLVPHLCQWPNSGPGGCPSLRHHGCHRHIRWEGWGRWHYSSIFLFQPRPSVWAGCPMLAWLPWVPSVPPLIAGGETCAALWSSEDAGAVPGDVSNRDLESVKIRYWDKSKYSIVKPFKKKWDSNTLCISNLLTLVWKV